MVLRVKLDLEGAVKALGTPAEEKPVARGGGYARRGQKFIRAGPQEAYRQKQHADTHLDLHLYPGYS